MKSRLVLEINDRNMVWQGFASCTSFKLLIDDKLQLFQQYLNDPNNNFKCSLVALEINNLYVIFNEQIISWIISIENWFSNKDKTLLWHLCNVGGNEIKSFIEKLSDNHNEITDGFLKPYTYSFDGEKKANIENELRHCFNLLYSYCLFGSNDDYKEILRGLRQIHDKTKHGYILFDSKNISSLFVPDGKYSKGIDVVDNDTSRIKPVVLGNKLNFIKMLSNYASIAVPFFQFVICVYSINRFGETQYITEEILKRTRGIMKEGHLQFISKTIEISPLSPSEAVAQFISRFEDCSLPKYQWTHEAHFYVGIWYLLKYDKERALNKIRDNIKKYNVSKGVQNTKTEGYHETVTRFYLWAIDKFVLKGVQEFSLEILKIWADSKIGEKNFPLEYYSKELLFSEEARLGWVEPNIKPLN